MASSMTVPPISNVLGTAHTNQVATQTVSNTQTMKVRPNCSDNRKVRQSSFTLQRKLDDALQTLDDAVFVPSDSLERPSPPKKSKSIYSTLAKYGIAFKEPKSLVYPDLFCFPLRSNTFDSTLVRRLHPEPPPLG